MLTIELKSKFLGLTVRLSPENLSCDGELTRGKIAARLKQIRKEWAQLEKQAQCEVQEDEPWSWLDEIREHDRATLAAKVAATPQHPLLKSSNPGVWSREGQSNLSAYYIQNDKFRGPAMYNGIDLLANASDEYHLYSEFSQVLNGKEKIGTYETLDGAVDAAEAFLKTVTREAYKAKRPLYREANIDRELLRLPA